MHELHCEENYVDPFTSKQLQ